MPNGSSYYQALCNQLGVDEKHRSKLFWASIVGTPVLCWALSSRSKTTQQPDTNINAFFKDKSAVRAPKPSPAKRQATSFHSFLKEVPQAHRDATSFGAFLKNAGSNPAATASTEPVLACIESPKASDVIITVLYGTEYGFSKEVAERVAAAITASGSYWYGTCWACTSTGFCLWLSPHFATRCLYFVG